LDGGQQRSQKLKDEGQIWVPKIREGGPFSLFLWVDFSASISRSTQKFSRKLDDFDDFSANV
jgi:hypothetical protein